MKQEARIAINSIKSLMLNEKCRDNQIMLAEIGSMMNKIYFVDDMKISSKLLVMTKQMSSKEYLQSKDYSEQSLLFIYKTKKFRK